MSTLLPIRKRLAVVAASVMLFAFALVPATLVGAQSGYPPNTVLSTYFDPRYGTVSVVTDGSGTVINVNAATGQRIFPVYSDYAGYGYGYGAPAYAGAYGNGFTGNGFGYAGNGYTNGYGSRQYTDNNSNCPNGDVTQTGAGFFCTATGQPAFRVS